MTDTNFHKPVAIQDPNSQGDLTTMNCSQSDTHFSKLLEPSAQNSVSPKLKLDPMQEGDSSSGMLNSNGVQIQFEPIKENLA